jgi:hypothetical protein
LPKNIHASTTSLCTLNQERYCILPLLPYSIFWLSLNHVSMYSMEFKCIDVVFCNRHCFFMQMSSLRLGDPSSFMSLTN